MSFLSHYLIGYPFGYPFNWISNWMISKRISKRISPAASKALVEAAAVESASAASADIRNIIPLSVPYLSLIQTSAPRAAGTGPHFSLPPNIASTSIRFSWCPLPSPIRCGFRGDGLICSPSTNAD